MIPILFSETATDFDTNGIGRLSDAISCTVTEERNGIFELEMQYPVDGEFYDSIRHSTIILAKPNEKSVEQPFRIYKISKPMNKRITVNAEHISYQLSYIPVSPFTASGVAAALSGLKGNAAEECPFDFWTDKTTNGDFAVTEPASIRSRMGGDEGSILDVFGGEYEFDRYMVRLHASRGADNGVRIAYGKNLTDVTQEESIENTITGIYPYWKDSDGNLVTLPEKTISAESAENYPFPRTVSMDFSSDFDEAPTEEQLRQRAEQYIADNNIGIPAVSLTVSFQPLWQTEEYKNVAALERVGLCDTVTVEYEKLGVSATARVNKTVYDVLKERYSSIELGESKPNLSDQIINQEKEIELKPDVSFLQQAIENATNLITGNKGGYIVYMYDGNGHPYEMLIMDQPDINTAQNVWRFNQAGLGHSSTGYEGPYETAITQDGAIVANFITAGVLSGNIIRGGTITDVDGKTSWNLNTGEMIADIFRMMGGIVSIKNDGSNTAEIEFSFGDSQSIRLTNFGLIQTTKIDDEHNRIIRINSSGFRIDEETSGGDITTKVSIGALDAEGKYLAQFFDYPSFFFQTADGQTVNVSNGLIRSIT